MTQYQITLTLKPDVSYERAVQISDLLLKAFVDIELQILEPVETETTEASDEAS